MPLHVVVKKHMLLKDAHKNDCFHQAVCNAVILL